MVKEVGDAGAPIRRTADDSGPPGRKRTRTRGIRCNAICPGAIDTPMVEDAPRGLPPEEVRAARDGFAGNQILKRFRLPEEVVPLVLFLCSDECLEC